MTAQLWPAGRPQPNSGTRVLVHGQRCLQGSRIPAVISTRSLWYSCCSTIRSLLASTLEPSSAGSRRKVADLSPTKLQRKGRIPSKFLDARFSQRWTRIPSKRSGKQIEVEKDSIALWGYFIHCSSFTCPGSGFQGRLQIWRTV